MNKSLTLVTRQSPLALAQAQLVKAQLEQHYPQLTITLLPLTTKGDQILDRSLAKIGGKGLFLKELQTALLTGQADFAVHSLKDMPADDVCAELTIAAFCERDDPRDCLVTRSGATLASLASGAVIGTSSLRRIALLKQLRPDVVIRDLRGNVNTRLEKLAQGDYDGIVLAGVGLKRLQLHAKISEYFSVSAMVPAVGQGILALECLTSRHDLLTGLASLNHLMTQHCAQAERAFSKRLGASCQTPVAGHAILLAPDRLQFTGVVADPHNHQVLQATAIANPAAAESLGIDIAQQLLQQGAQAILDHVS